MTAPRANLLGLNRIQLENYFQQMGQPKFRATQVLQWIHQRGVTNFQRMTNFSQTLRDQLSEAAEIRPPTVLKHQVSKDGTHKWLFEIDNRNGIETVFIPENGRGTLCVSSQVGCALNCSFCATARQGFNRNLDAAEIIGQVWLARRLLVTQGFPSNSITNVVLMGMGEPLLNFEAVTDAIDIMLEDTAYGLGKRRVTLSTAGVVPGIRRLQNRSAVSLAVSLHAASDALRDQLVPLNKTYPIAELLAACHDYVRASHKAKITFEYVMLDGVNDQPVHARQLVRLISGIACKVNLIPFNSSAGIPYEQSPAAAIDAFRDTLKRAGVVTITRKTRGDDIDAACGQLAGRVQPRSRRVALRRGLARTGRMEPNAATRIRPE